MIKRILWGGLSHIITQECQNGMVDTRRVVWMADAKADAHLFHGFYPNIDFYICFSFSLSCFFIRLIWDVGVVGDMILRLFKPGTCDYIAKRLKPHQDATTWTFQTASQLLSNTVTNWVDFELLKRSQKPQHVGGTDFRRVQQGGYREDGQCIYFLLHQRVNALLGLVIF